MKIAILHYHLNRGGVTRVIQNHLLALDAALGPGQTMPVAVIYGGRRADWPEDLPDRLQSIRLTLHAVPPLDYDDQEATDPAQSGTLDEQLAGGLGKIELLLEEDTDSGDGSQRLIRRITTNLLASRAVTPGEQVLCRNVVSLNLRYFDGSGWVDEWDSTADANSLPLAVEVDIEISYNGKNAKNQNRESQKRRLVQSFALPCQTAAQEESESTL